MTLTSLLFPPLLAVHVAAGTIAIGAGATAMVARKGRSSLHVPAGRYFVGAMLVMTTSAAALTWWEPDPLSTTIAILTLYLVATAWMSARGRGLEWRRFEWAASAVGLGCAVALGRYGIVAAQSIDGEVGGSSPPAFFVFGGVALLAVLLDLNFLVRRTVSPRQRFARHLWRMCMAFFIAATSLFLGQQDDVFFFMQGSPLLNLPSLATLIFMVYWLIRVRRQFRGPSGR